jgi:hypothetical protein
MTISGRRRPLAGAVALLCAIAAGSFSLAPPAGASGVVPNGNLLTIGGSAGSGRATTVGEEPVSVGAGPGMGLLVADDSANAVRLITTAGTEELVAGNNLAGYNGDDRAATSASLDAPAAAISDSHGDVIIADASGSRVRLVAAATCKSGCPFGLASTVAGQIYTVAGDGTAGYSGDGFKATTARLDDPQGLALDPAGDLLISDSFNNRVRMVAASNCTTSCPFGLPSLVAGDIYTVAGDGLYGYNGNGISAQIAELADPGQLAIDRSGDLVIADGGNNRVQLVAWQPCTSGCRFGLATITEGDIYTIAGDGKAGGVSGSLGEGGAGPSAELDAPAGVAVDPEGDVMIADTLDNLVRVLVVQSCAASCPYGTGATTAGDIYAVAGNGTAGFSGDGGLATAAELRAPASVYVDSFGNVLVADTGNDRVRLVVAAACGAACSYGQSPTAVGDIYTIGGNGVSNFSGDGGPAGDAELLAPHGLAVDGAGNVAVADTGNERVRLVAAGSCGSGCPYGLNSTAAGDIYTIAGNGTAGFYGDGGRATSAELDNPSDVSPAGGGGLVIADTGNNRLRFVASANCPSSCPYGLGTTRAGDIYTIAGDGIQGFSGDGGRATAAALYAPLGVALGQLDEILVADTGNNRIRMVAAVDCSSACPFGIPTVAGDIYTIAGTGALGFAGDGGPARSAALAQPGGVALGPSGSLVISDSLNNRVRFVASQSCSGGCGYGLPATVPGDIYTIGGTGAFNYSGDRGPARLAALADPAGVAVDAAGNVYVADTDNLRIRMISDEHCFSACRFGVSSLSPGTIASVIGSGNLAVSPSGEPASDLSLAAPTSVAVDATGALVILESADGGIRRLYPEPTDGFVLATSAGDVYAFAAPNDGSLAGVHLSAPIIGIASDNLAGGYWLVGTDGGVYAFGGAKFYGSMGGQHLNKPIVAIAGTADGRGYWLVASDGGIFAFGDARFLGSMGGRHLNKPIVGMAASPDGRGYWLVATDGGLFTFGDSKYRGSEGGTRLTRPIFAMAATPDGFGYWLVASDGGIFTFGDAHFHGSLGGFVLKSSIVGMATDAVTGGYRLADADGRVYPFQCSSYGGSNISAPAPVVAIATDH